jgi:hypothetical protein
MGTSRRLCCAASRSSRLPAERYSIKTGHLIEQIDFVDHPTIANAGASPDGLIDDDMIVEFKAPETHNSFRVH